ncbi:MULTISPECIES: xanthosine phosphorylase [Edwardsiella]|uniref:Purine nucleoside phosphorylase n=2 Tax=Edwardsiella anguillarum TaxID=1821960 RepID=A0A076LP25_9GAMM|nr:MULTISPECIES: xanthosine phosphorylase [Edwardsiella]AKM47039.1 purine nucleoside phosphorylase [Edwardsiella sp. EA181011]GAJ67308.1 xanthosine phosphorylase [Edwardsiella piscicida]AIJ07424.1 Xanthosine phosphorylase [Edwardsiella anguillarum ET080813]AKR78672.1 xanthosine phosphorylase [Edwardsiella sp. LADL05-105]KAB0586784.1 xanthosine phosphorylase [Edwardsiella anguillarum]
MSRDVFNDSPYQAAEILRAAKPNFSPRIAMILGSGLGTLADRLDNKTGVSYDALPGFPVSSVSGHAGEVVMGTLHGIPLLCMKGRGHFYEGAGMGIMTQAVRTFKLLGCELMLCTNAAGSLNPAIPAGSLVALSDHINTLPSTPLVGPNDERFGPRFFSLANAYDTGLRQRLHASARELNLTLYEGVYVSYPGPNFETAAEIRMMQRMGGDVVGMSVVPEVIAARHCGLKVLAVSAITNMAEGLGDVELSHEQTLKCAAMLTDDFIHLISQFVKNSR